MPKQTAVEWLLDILITENEVTLKGENFKLFEMAKAMEKEQIIDACNLQRNDYKGMPTYNKSGEQYYNETYKGKEQS
jgi:hypothetical protein